jgi:tetratricopeptide (TPR) repeat protein
LDSAISDQVERHSWLGDTALSHLHLHAVSADMDELKAAERLFREALSLNPIDHPHRAWTLCGLSQSLFIRWVKTGEEEALVEADNHLVACLQLRPPGHALRYEPLGLLANVHRARFACSSDKHYMSEAFIKFKNALSCLAPTHSARPAILANLASIYNQKYDESGITEDLESAITTWEELYSNLAPDHVMMRRVYTEYGGRLLDRYNLHGDVVDLERSIYLLRKNSDMSAQSKMAWHGQYEARWTLGNCLRMRYMQYGEQEDMVEALDLLRATLALCPPDYPYITGDVADVLLSICDGESINLSYIEEAIELTNVHLATGNPAHVTYRYAAYGLSLGLQARYRWLGCLEDLQRAIEAAKMSLEACQKEH